MDEARDRDLQAFTETFAADEDRQRTLLGDYQWLVGGVALVLGSALVLLTAWLASREALPTSGLFAMRASGDESVEVLRARNHAAAPMVAVAALPLFVSGLWLLLRRPDNNVTRGVAWVAAVIFGGVIVFASVVGP